MVMSLAPELVKAMAQEAIETSTAPQEVLTPIGELVALQRKWRLAYGPESAIPDDLLALRKVVPSGLTDAERLSFILGSLNEARRAYVRVLNTSWTKAKLNEQATALGVPRALESFDEATQASLRTVIRFLTDA